MIKYNLRSAPAHQLKSPQSPRHSGLDPESRGDMVSYKSCQSGLFFSINSIFQARFQFFKVFSLVIADIMVSCSSYHISLWTLYRLVNPSTKLFLCSHTLFIKSDVTPTYKVPFFLLAKMYTAGLLFNVLSWIPDQVRNDECNLNNPSLVVQMLNLLGTNSFSNKTYSCNP